MVDLTRRETFAAAALPLVTVEPLPDTTPVAAAYRAYKEAEDTFRAFGDITGKSELSPNDPRYDELHEEQSLLCSAATDAMYRVFRLPSRGWSDVALKVAAIRYETSDTGGELLFDTGELGQLWADIEHLAQPSL